MPIGQLQYQDIEISELGQRLPIGIFLPNGDRLTEYSLRPYTGHHDILLGRLEDENADHPNRINRIFTHFLPELVASIGGYSLQELLPLFPGMSMMNFFGEMYLADILSIILNARWKAYGGDIALSLYCPCPQRVKIEGGKDGLPCHDLTTVVVRSLADNGKMPIFSLTIDGSNYGGIPLTRVFMEPPRFHHILKLKETIYPPDLTMLFSVASVEIGDLYLPFNSQMYKVLRLKDLNILHEAVKYLHFGPDRTIEMDCPQCKLSWKNWLHYGEMYETFYTSLFSPPRSKNQVGGAEELLNEVSFFLTTGSDAPFSSPTEVLNLTPSSRDFWVRKLSDMYTKQKEEMDKAKSKSKSRN